MSEEANSTGEEESLVGKTIDVAALRHSMYTLRVDHPTVIQAFRVAQELQDWFSEHASAADMCWATVDAAENGVLVKIHCHVGSILVWDDSSNSTEELNMRYCLRQYREAGEQILEPFAEEVEQIPLQEGDEPIRADLLQVCRHMGPIQLMALLVQIANDVDHAEDASVIHTIQERLGQVKH